MTRINIDPEEKMLSAVLDFAFDQHSAAEVCEFLEAAALRRAEAVLNEGERKRDSRVYAEARRAAFQWRKVANLFSSMADDVSASSFQLTE